MNWTASLPWLWLSPTFRPSLHPLPQRASLSDVSGSHLLIILCMCCTVMLCCRRVSNTVLFVSVRDGHAAGNARNGLWPVFQPQSYCRLEDGTFIWRYSTIVSVRYGINQWIIIGRRCGVLIVPVGGRIWLPFVVFVGRCRLRHGDHLGGCVRILQCDNCVDCLLLRVVVLVGAALEYV